MAISFWEATTRTLARDNPKLVFALKGLTTAQAKTLQKLVGLLEIKAAESAANAAETAEKSSSDSSRSSTECSRSCRKTAANAAEAARQAAEAS